MADTDQHQPAAAAPGLSEAEIGEIQARVDAAAPGPWQAKSTHGGPYRDDLGRAQAGFWIPELESLGDGECSAMLEDDAQFAAHARLDIPRLLADLARTRAEAAALKDAVQAELHIDEQEVRGLCSGMTKAKADWYVRESIRGKRLRKALAAPQSEQPPAAPVAPSAEPTHQSWCALGRFSYSHCTCGAITPPDHQAGDEHV